MKKKSLFITICLPLLALLPACSDWLDVQQDTEKKADEMFDDYNGFKGALTGCYASLAGVNLYGTRLTMSDVDALAGLWYIDPTWELSATLSSDYALSIHDYNNDYAKEAIKSIYGAFYNTILQANLVLEGCREKGRHIPDRQVRALVEGEAYAIRALCQFDLLRLFGQLPDGATRQVSLPYSFTTGLEEVPSYYAYRDYVALLQSDIDSALVRMKDNDPLRDYTYAQLNTLQSSSSLNIEDDFLTNRHLRMNYWAVKALQSRFYLYIGEQEKAYATAMEVINAKTDDGTAVTGLSSMKDYGEDGGVKFNSESECLFGVWIRDLHSLSVNLLAGGEAMGLNITNVTLGQTLLLTEGRYENLFSETVTATDIRYKNLWSKTKSLSDNMVYPTIRKYYVNKENSNSNAEGIIPLFRLSEMYLIAVETAPLAEAENLYKEYLLSKNVLWNTGFSGDVNARQEELMREYRREYFAEGQLFYFYKRHKTPLLWSQEGQMTEGDYILPLPNTEYNPNNK